MSKAAGTKFFNEQKYLKAAKKLGSWKNRRDARSNGKADGRLGLAKSSTSESDFENQCEWIKEKKHEANTIQSEAAQELLTSSRLLLEKRKVILDELSTQDKKIAGFQSRAAQTFSKQPSFNYSFRVVFMALFFVVEFVFTVAALYGSGAFPEGVQVLLALVFGFTLVLLCHLLGMFLRELPLSPSTATESSYRRQYSWISLCIVGLIACLIAVNVLRSYGIGTHGRVRVPDWVFMLFGVGLVLVGVLWGNDHEYSGPLYGLAKHERLRKLMFRELAQCEASLDRLDGFLMKLNDISASNIQRLFSIYVRHYQRSLILNERISSRG